MLNLLVLDDDLPELAESFQVRLLSARSGDGKPGSTPTSGASIDPDNSVTKVTVRASDHPYGTVPPPPRHAEHIHKARVLSKGGAILSQGLLYK